MRGLLRGVSELESIGDSLFNLARTIDRKRTQKAVFPASQEEGIDEMFTLLNDAMENMVLVLKGTGDNETSLDLENRIDALRTKLRNQNTVDVDEGVYSFAVGTIFTDLVRECEKCGDYVINVVESKMGKRDNTPESGNLQIDVTRRRPSSTGMCSTLRRRSSNCSASWHRIRAAFSPAPSCWNWSGRKTPLPANGRSMPASAGSGSRWGTWRTASVPMVDTVIIMIMTDFR